MLVGHWFERSAATSTGAIANILLNADSLIQEKFVKLIWRVITATKENVKKDILNHANGLRGVEAASGKTVLISILSFQRIDAKKQISNVKGVQRFGINKSLS